MRVSFYSLVVLLIPATNAFSPWNVVAPLRPGYVAHHSSFSPSSTVDLRPTPLSTRLHATTPNGEDDSSSFQVYQKLQSEVDQAAEETVQAEERILELEKQVSSIQQDIEAKQRLLNEGDDEWQREKVTFAVKIADLTNKLQGKDDDGKEKLQALELQNQEREQELTTQLNQLKSTLKQAQTALEQERQAAEANRKRLYKAEDNLEFEQMRFEKEKKDLDGRIQSELQKLKKVESQFQQEQDVYNKERNSLETKIKEEVKRLSQAQAQLDRDSQRFATDQEKLNTKLEAQSSKLRETQERLAQEQSKQKEETSALQKMVDQERARVKNMENQLQQDEREFRAAKIDLETRIRQEQTKVKDLSSKLEQQTLQHEQDKAILEETIFTEKTRLADIQQQLNAEVTQFEREKKRLEQQVVDGERVRNLKARQMANRYDAIQKEMTDLWQSAKREGETERRVLTKKYESELAVVTDTIERLESSLTDEQQTAQDLQQLVDDVKREKREVLEDHKKREAQFVRQVAQKNGIIAGLRTDVSLLEGELANREEIIEDYENNFGKILKQSVVLSGKRIKRSGSRLKNLVARNEKKSKSK